jgi:hypothetical protein
MSLIDFRLVVFRKITIFSSREKPQEKRMESIKKHTILSLDHSMNLNIAIMELMELMKLMELMESMNFPSV